MNPSYIRAFFALDLPMEHKQHLAKAMDALRQHLEKSFKPRHFRWVKPQSLHITLQFLARVNEDDLASLIQQVRSELDGLQPFYLQLGQVEWFPSPYVPHVLSLKTQPHETLVQLSSAIGKGILASSYEIEDRPFRGHLTLGRVEGLRHIDPESLSTFSWPILPEIFIKDIVFFKSEAERSGSIYSRLASLELGGGFDN